MRSTSIHNAKGFTLIELVLTIALFAILTVIAIGTLTNQVDETRFEKTKRRMLALRKAMIGDTAALRGDTRSEFGYLGDVGGIPSAAQGLAALLANPGVPASGWALNATARIGAGWNGPYLKGDDSGEDFTRDGWNSAFVYNASTNPPSLVSLGSDRVSGGTGYAADLTVPLTTDLRQATVFGIITQAGTQWSGAAEVEINYPNGSGVLTQTMKSVVAADKGLFNFPGIPLGVRSVTVYVPTKATATSTLGPVIFTCDRPFCLIPATYLDLAGPTVGPTNLEVPIEMVDYGLSSAIIGLFTTFERTRTPLDTSDYDGVVTYFFEMVATNIGIAGQVVSLINAAGGSVLGATIPAGTNVPTRFRFAFTPTAGANNYRIQFPITLLLNQISVTSARILVRQQNATKTNLYVPLIADLGTRVDTSDSVAVDTTASTTFTQATPARYGIWQKNASALSLDAGTPYRLSVSIAGGILGATATAALYNRTTGLAVTGASVSATGTNFSLQQASFADNAANFTDLNEFEVRIRSSTGLQNASIARAGLWIKLSSLGKGEAYYRVGKSYTGTASPVADGQRVYIDTTAFTNPTAYAEGVAVSTSAAGLSMNLLDAGAADAGTAGTAVPGSTLTWGLVKTRQRSTALTLGTATRYLQSAVTTAGQTASIGSGLILIQFHY